VALHAEFERSFTLVEIINKQFKQEAKDMGDVIPFQGITSVEGVGEIETRVV
jgi:hypothetical protein